MLINFETIDTARDVIALCSGRACCFQHGKFGSEIGFAPETLVDFKRRDIALHTASPTTSPPVDAADHVVAPSPASDPPPLVPDQSPPPAARPPFHPPAAPAPVAWPAAPTPNWDQTVRVQFLSFPPDGNPALLLEKTAAFNPLNTFVEPSSPPVVLGIFRIADAFRLVQTDQPHDLYDPIFPLNVQRC